MTKDVFDAMRECHSVRHFIDQEIPEATVTRILEAACWAPSAGNLQPWQFYVIYNDDSRRRLQKVSSQEQIGAAPVIIVVFADPTRSQQRYGERGGIFCVQDTAAAVENMLLAAEGLGISSCWVGDFDEQEVVKVCEAPAHYRAMAIVCLGYSEEKHQSKQRFSMQEVVKILH